MHKTMLYGQNAYSVAPLNSYILLTFLWENKDENMFTKTVSVNTLNGTLHASISPILKLHKDSENAYQNLLVQLILNC
jgi:hypothetical protein